MILQATFWVGFSFWFTTRGWIARKHPIPIKLERPDKKASIELFSMLAGTELLELWLKPLSDMKFGEYLQLTVPDGYS